MHRYKLKILISSLIIILLVSQNCIASTVSVGGVTNDVSSENLLNDNSKFNEVISSWQWVKGVDTVLPQLVNQKWELQIPVSVANEDAFADEIHKLLPAEIITEKGTKIALSWDLSDVQQKAASQQLAVRATLATGYVFKDQTTTLTVYLELPPNEQNQTSQKASTSLLQSQASYQNQSRASDADFDDMLLNTGVTPEGTNINLFDYWVTSQDAADNEDPINLNQGINANHVLKFSLADKANNSYPINYFTDKNKYGLTGIVQDTLRDGYPILSENSSLQTNGESLKYLFDPQTTSNGKASYPAVKNLLQYDDKIGYYTYDSSKNFASFSGTENQSGGKFKLYNKQAVFLNNEKNQHWWEGWLVKYERWGDSPRGGFYPFNTASQVFSKTQDTAPYKKIDTRDEALNHYFGLMLSNDFVQPVGGIDKNGNDLSFEFSGDDDVWIFIDGVLVSDLGGISVSTKTNINFRTGEVTFSDANTNDKIRESTTLYKEFENAYEYNPQGQEFIKNNFTNNTFKSGTKHQLQMFYLERGNNASNLSLKFNLTNLPTNDVVQVDQTGSPVAGVNYSLYGTNSTYGIADDSQPLATGQTAADGKMVLKNSEGKPLTTQDLTKSDYKYFVLRQDNIPEGYRKNDELHLYLPTELKEPMLLLDNYWQTGSYASPKDSITVRSSVEAKNGQMIDLTQGGKLFAVVCRYDGQQWAPVIGNYQTGWKVEKGGTSVANIVKLVSQNADDYQGFSSDSSINGYSYTFNDLPGDVKDYEEVQNTQAKDAPKYQLRYYYTTAANTSLATADNTQEVMTSDSQQQNSGLSHNFATNVVVANVANHLYVKAKDTQQASLAGATFALYSADSVKDGKLQEGAQPVDVAKTQSSLAPYGMEGAAVFPSSSYRHAGLAKGTYYLKELDIPTSKNDKANDQLIKVVVSDQGVIADANQAGDGVSVSVGVGRIVDSIVRFATGDINKTLQDVTFIPKQLPSNESPDSDNWKILPSEKLELSYDNDNNLYIYGPTKKDGATSYSSDTGWLSGDVYQNYNTDVSSDLKNNLGKQNLDKLYTGMMLVNVTSQSTFGQLTINNTFTGTKLPNPSQEFTYQITLKGANNQAINNSYTATKVLAGGSTKNQTIQFTDGVANVKLAANEKLILPTLPNETKFTVKVTVPDNLALIKVLNNGVANDELTDTTRGSIDEGENVSVTFMSSAKLDFYNTDEDGNNYLAGTEYKLYQYVGTKGQGKYDLITFDKQGNLSAESKQAWSLVATKTSGSDGKIDFSNLDFDHVYRLVETKVPKGYLLPKGQWNLTADENQNILVPSGIENPPAFEQKEGKYVVKNAQAFVLPGTGTKLSYLGAIGLVLIVGGMCLYVWSKKRSKEIRR